MSYSLLWCHGMALMLLAPHDSYLFDLQDWHLISDQALATYPQIGLVFETERAAP